jgi:hypothetical protein
MLARALNHDFRREAEALRGTYANYSHCDRIIDQDAYIITGQGLLARLLPGVLPTKAMSLALPVMRSVTKLVQNRGEAMGRGSLMPRILKTGPFAGMLSGTNEIPHSVSELAGFSDQLGYLDGKPWQVKRNTHVCRPTSWTRDCPEDLDAMMPIVEEIDKAFRDELPSYYATQLAIIQRSGSFHLGNTAFSTINCNRNWQTAYHKDKGDLRDGWAALFTIGNYQGGALCFPRYRVAFNMRPGDVLICDPHQVHGNLPFTGDDFLQGVLFGTERIASCGGR